MLATRVPPPLLTLALGLAMWFAAVEGPVPPWRGGAALAAFAAAGVFGFPALRAFRGAGTTINPVQVDRASALVTSGVYGVSRNPMYVALTLLLCAWAFWLGGAWVWAGPVVLVLWLDRLQIVPEERAMAARFGDEFARYRERVRRWI